MAKFDPLSYFNEHVLYELQMLRYSKSQLELQINTPEDQLHWNAMFAAFNVSARNLYDFMTGDPKNISVTDYVHLRRPNSQSPNGAKVWGTVQMLNAQCFHMGERRSEDAADKVTIERIGKMYDWLEANMKLMFASFHDGFEINRNKADWQHTQLTLIPPSKVSATNILQSITGPTSSQTTSSPDATFVVKVNTTSPEKD